MSRAHSSPAVPILSHNLELDNDHDGYPPLLDPQTLSAKIFLVARAISLLILLGLVAGSAQILGLVQEVGGVEGDGSPPDVMVVLLVAAAAGMAHVLISLACLATRRLPSLALVWAVDLLFSGGLLALAVFIGVEVTGTCDVGEGPFGFEGLSEQRDDVCKKLSMAWALGMAGGGLFVVSGVTAGVVHCNQQQSDGAGVRDTERGWAVEGWRLEGLGEGIRYPVDA